MSFGTDFIATLANGTTIQFFEYRLITIIKIDERNLTKCLYLNLQEALIMNLDTVHFGALRVLMLAYCKIHILNTIPLVNLQFLQIQSTNIKYLFTAPLK